MLDEKTTWKDLEGKQVEIEEGDNNVKLYDLSLNPRPRVKNLTLTSRVENGALIAEIKGDGVYVAAAFDAEKTPKGRLTIAYTRLQEYGFQITGYSANGQTLQPLRMFSSPNQLRSLEVEGSQENVNYYVDDICSRYEAFAGERALEHRIELSLSPYRMPVLKTLKPISIETLKKRLSRSEEEFLEDVKEHDECILEDPTKEDIDLTIKANLDLLRTYLQGIAKYPLLTKDEEQELTRKYAHSREFVDRSFNLALTGLIAVSPDHVPEELIRAYQDTDGSKKQPTTFTKNTTPIEIAEARAILESYLEIKTELSDILEMDPKQFVSDRYVRTPITEHAKSLSLVDFSYPTRDKLRVQTFRNIRDLSTIIEDQLARGDSEVRIGKRTIPAQVAEKLLSSFYAAAQLNRLRPVLDTYRNGIAMHNMRLVVHIAKGYGDLRDLLDRVQDGNFGLFKAVERFDYRLGHRFSTYATWWIRQSIKRALAENSLIRCPSHAYDFRYKIEITRSKLESERKDASNEAVAKALGVPLKRIEAAKKLTFRSLDQPTIEDEDSTGYDIIADPSTVDNNGDFRRTREIETRIGMSKLLATLSPREEKVLRLRWGIGGKEHTLEEVGAMLRVTRERIRQIEDGAKNRIRINPRALEYFLQYVEE